MEDDIKKKIEIYCKKINMKMDNFSIVIAEDGYVARDGYTSIMFDKEGNVSSLPMYQAYGKKTTQFIGKASGAMCMYAIIVIVILTIIFGIIK